MLPASPLWLSGFRVASLPRSPLPINRSKNRGIPIGAVISSPVYVFSSWRSSAGFGLWKVMVRFDLTAFSKSPVSGSSPLGTSTETTSEAQLFIRSIAVDSRGRSLPFIPVPKIASMITQSLSGSGICVESVISIIEVPAFLRILKFHLAPAVFISSPLPSKNT
ncbi:MAG: hypothetical protein ANIMEMIM_00299 [Candidatus Argoarchaeum ethanivorans]|uniref:Uncharacterized protein n=1 Tax=Candidatus Argoarchaeum ethanivorans TaxID=2608793 RepID=A0A811TC25_9EURY|nr:MAG: hypothetical protein ANIMEMIM_00299 [Candidatus Argoarchaeum ethanivorans]